VKKITDYIAALRLDTKGAFNGLNQFDKRVVSGSRKVVASNKRAKVSFDKMGRSAAVVAQKAGGGFGAFEKRAKRLAPVIRTVNKRLERTDDRLAAIQRRARRMRFSRFRSNLGKVNTSLKDMRFQLAGIATAGVFAIGKLGRAGSDLQESITAVQAVFKENQKSILDFGKTSATTVGISNKAFNEAAAGLGPILANTGASGEELNMMLIEITKRAADLGSVRNVPIAEVIANFTSGLVGQTEPLLKYGVNLTQANLQQIALGLGITKSVKKMTEQEKAMLRYRAILQKTTFSAGDFQKNVNSIAIQLQVQKARAEDLAASYGKDLEPVIKKLLKVTNKLLTFFENMSPTMRRVIVVGGVLVTGLAALGFALSFVGTAITGFITVGGFMATALTALTGGLGIAKIAMIAFNFVLSINPIVLVVTAVLALVFVFRDDLIPIVKSVASKLSEFSDLLIFFPNPIGVLIGSVKFLSNVFEFGLGGAIDILWQKMKSFFDFIKNSKIGQFVGDLAGAVASLFGDDDAVGAPPEISSNVRRQQAADRRLSRFRSSAGSINNTSSTSTSTTSLTQSINVTAPNAQQAANQILISTDAALGAAT